METAIGIVAGFVGGALIAFGGSYYLWVLQRTKRELGYEVLSSNVLIPGPPEPTPDIKIIVKNELIDPATPFVGQYSEVSEVLGFRIRLRNTGNEVVEDQPVTIKLSEQAVTLSAQIESQPDMGEREIIIEPQSAGPSETRVTLPFLNPGQEVVLSLQSVRNADAGCHISAGAPGLLLADLGQRGTRRLYAGLAASGVVIVAGVAASTVLMALALSRNGEHGWIGGALWAAVFGTWVGPMVLLFAILGPTPFFRILRGT